MIPKYYTMTDPLQCPVFYINSVNDVDNFWSLYYKSHNEKNNELCMYFDGICEQLKELIVIKNDYDKVYGTYKKQKESIVKYRNIEEELKSKNKISSNKSLELSKKNEKLIKQLEDNNRKISEMQETHKNEVEKIKTYYDGIISELKKKEKKSLPTPDNSDDENVYKKKLVTRDQIEKDYPISFCTEFKNSCYEYAAGELCNKIKYNYTLKNMVDNDKGTSLDDICKYILDSEKFINKNSNTKDYNIEKKIKRCYYLYKTYGDKLKHVNFNTGRVFRLGEVKWKIFLSVLDEKIKLVIDDQKKKLKIKNIKNKLLKLFILSYYKNKFLKLEMKNKSS